jgi:hypothetical protein
MHAEFLLWIEGVMIGDTIMDIDDRSNGVMVKDGAFKKKNYTSDILNTSNLGFIFSNIYIYSYYLIHNNKNKN